VNQTRPPANSLELNMCGIRLYASPAGVQAAVVREVVAYRKGWLVEVQPGMFGGRIRIDLPPHMDAAVEHQALLDLGVPRSYMRLTPKQPALSTIARSVA
jgi:hypothetical protein